MPKLHPIKTHFSAGEITPLLHGRSDIQGYNAGLKKCLNWIPTRHGAIERRPGTRYLGNFDGYDAKLIDFQINENEVYTLAFSTDGNMYANIRSGSVYGKGYASDPYFYDPTNWLFDIGSSGGGGYAGGGRALLAAEGVAANYSSTIRLGNLGHSDLATGPGYITLRARPLVEGYDADNDNTTLTIHGQDAYTSPGVIYFSEEWPKGEEEITIRFESIGTTTINFIATVDGNGADRPPVWELTYLNYGIIPNSTNDEVVVAHNYEDYELPFLQHEHVPGEDKIYIFSPFSMPHEVTTDRTSTDPNKVDALTELDIDHRPATFKGKVNFDTNDGSQDIKVGYTVELLTGYAGGGTAENVYRAVSAQTALNLGAEDYSNTAEWEDLGTASDWKAQQNRSYPGSGTFYQGRLWLTGFPSDQDNFYGSKSGEYLSFDVGTALDNESIHATLDDHAFVQWVAGRQDLLLGTENGEYVISAASSPSGLITPSDIRAQSQSVNGSAHMQGEPVNNAMVYVSHDGTKVRDMEYKFVVNGWQSRDMSLTAEHLFREYGAVKEIHFLKDPAQVIWLVTEKGVLLSCTFDQANDVIGWARHDFAGRVVSACVTKFRGINELTIAIDRDFVVSATPGLYLERLDPTICTDCSEVLYYANNVQGKFIDFDPLSSQEVAIFADKQYKGDRTLNSSGASTFPTNLAMRRVGLKFTSTFETLPADYSAQGAPMDAIKSWAAIIVRVFESYMPTIEGETAERMIDDSEQISESNGSSTITEKVTGDAKVNASDHSQRAIVTVTHSDPTPVCISGLFGRMVGSST